jgi:predicted nuclease with TOPRIM domain
MNNDKCSFCIHRDRDSKYCKNCQSFSIYGLADNFLKDNTVLTKEQKQAQDKVNNKRIKELEAEVASLKDEVKKLKEDIVAATSTKDEFSSSNNNDMDCIEMGCIEDADEVEEDVIEKAKMDAAKKHLYQYSMMMNSCYNAK